MARPLRLEFAGALYHITSRGNRREDICQSDSDREQFLALLGSVCEQHNWCCYAYCLMSNHYHLLVETPDSNLSVGMRQLNGVYTQYFNKKHSRVGHVFQGRYKSILVDKESYLLELVRYIVLNPVRARMVRTAKDWPWSSYRATTGQVEPPTWLHVDWVLAAFAKSRFEAIDQYKQFANEGNDHSSPWEYLKQQIYLGDDAFIEKTLKHIDSDKKLSEIPATQRRPVPKSLVRYAAGSGSRDKAIVRAYNSGGYTMKQIGEYFGLHYSRVSRILSRAGQWIHASHCLHRNPAVIQKISKRSSGRLKWYSGIDRPGN